jgi:predicted SAM-dependent methyltransferase
LNLGCGPFPLPGYVNIDGLDLPGVDVIADLSEALPFEDGAVVIYASHVLEHFATDDVPGRLAEWRRVLREGGSLLIAVPNLDVIAHEILETPGWFTPPHNPWLGAIYGGQKDEYDFHKTGFTGPWLAHLLTAAGFGAIEQVDRFHEGQFDDASFSPLPFGRNVSLNMRAIAGGTPIDAGLFLRSNVERTFDRLDGAVVSLLRLSSRARASVMYRRRKRLERAISS